MQMTREKKLTPAPIEAYQRRRKRKIHYYYRIVKLLL